MSKYLSDKLRVISFMLICMVVLLHSQILIYTETSCSMFVQSFFSEQITKIAVDFFFVISGFLFAYSLNSQNLKTSFTNKIVKRFHSLLIPYVIWVGLGIMFSLMVSVVHPNLSKIHSWHDVATEFVVAPKIVYQMWFVRDLFIVCLLSPVLYWIIRKFGIVSIIGLLIWYVFFWTSLFVSLGAIVFFSLGMYFSMYHKKWAEYRFKSFIWISLLVIWLAYCALLTYYQPKGAYYFVISLLLGMSAIWTTYDIVSEKLREKFTSTSIITYSFFIFLFHEPLLTIVKKGYINTIGVNTDFTSLTLYFTAPIMVITICFVVGKTLKAHYPSVYRILTGGR